MYQTGKGTNHLVPVLVPEDTTEALQTLGNANIRKTCDIRDDNKYLFPSIRDSDSSVSACYCLKAVCLKARSDGYANHCYKNASSHKLTLRRSRRT